MKTLLIVAGEGTHVVDLVFALLASNYLLSYFTFHFVYAWLSENSPVARVSDSARHSSGSYQSEISLCALMLI